MNEPKVEYVFRNTPNKEKSNRKGAFCQRQDAAITLIALVVTIVVLLILAGITIQLVISDGGIFNQAQKSKEQTRIGELLDKFNVSEATVSLEKFGKPSLEDFINQVQNKEGYVEEVEKEGDKNYIVITDDGYVFDVSIIEGTNTNDIIVEYVGKADSVLLKEAVITFSSTETQAEEAITATVTHIPNSNSIVIENCKWLYSRESSKIGKNSPDWNSENAGSFTSNGQTIDLNTDEGGSFYLHVLSVDASGAKRETVAGPITVKPKPAEEFSRGNGTIDVAFVNMSNQPISASSVPTPKLGEGMVPVKWNEEESSWYVCQSTDNEWYSYTEADKKWANVMLRDGLVVDGVTNTSTATIEEMAGKKVTTMGSMFVYVPRYGYKITYTTADGATILGYSDSTGITNKSGGIVVGTEKQSAVEVKGTLDGKKIEKYVLHPAFQKFDSDELTMKNGGWEEELEGIWVAKFEASQVTNTTTFKILPAVRSWDRITINNAFSYCNNYNTLLKSHLIKNSEWGAVTYLTKSKYGANGEVWINQNFNNQFTGRASSGPNASWSSASEEYNSSNGRRGSTTGTIYGIYDMCGGNWEYVASYINNGSTYLQNYGTSLVSNTNSYLKQVYNKGNSDDQQLNYEANKGIYGDAIYETSIDGLETKKAWYQEWSAYPYSSGAYFLRGGGYTDEAQAGLFAFSYDHRNYSNTFSYYGFRPVLCSQ